MSYTRLLETDKVRINQHGEWLMVTSACCNHTVSWYNLRETIDLEALCTGCNGKVLVEQPLAIVGRLLISNEIGTIRYWISRWTGIEEEDIVVEVKENV